MSVAGALHLDYRDIGNAVGAYELRALFGAVVKIHHYGARALYNVIAGDYVAVIGDDNAGAAARVYLLARVAGGHGDIYAHHRVHALGDYLNVVVLAVGRGVMIVLLIERGGGVVIGIVGIRGGGTRRKLGHGLLGDFGSGG